MLSQTELTTSQLPGAADTTLPVKVVAEPQGKRLLFLDNLRIVLICGVLVNHLDDTYGAIGAWEYHDPVTNLLTGTLLSILNGILMACGMGFFFLLAGYFTPGSYDRKGPRAFLQGRLVRLGLPLLLYDLLIQPLVVYLAGGLLGSYWSFYGTFLLQMRGVTGVVWFLAVLLLFDLLYAGWRGLTGYRRSPSATSGTLPSYMAIAGFIFALGLLSFVVRIWWPLGWTFQPLPGLKVGYLPQYGSLYPFLCDYQFHWRCYRRRARASYPGNLAGQPHARSSDPAGEGSNYCPLCLGHGRAQFIAGPGVSRPVSYSGELDVLSSRSVRGCDRLKPARQCAWSKRGRAGIAESIDGAAGTANSERRHDSVCIRDHLCTASRACECCLIVNLFAVFAHCNGVYCRAGCDLAWIITGELPTFALNLELGKHVEIKYDSYPQVLCTS